MAVIGKLDGGRESRLGVRILCVSACDFRECCLQGLEGVWRREGV